jgi:hypothetical protein
MKNTEAVEALRQIITAIDPDITLPSVEEMKESGVSDFIMREALDSIDVFHEDAEWCRSYR